MPRRRGHLSAVAMMEYHLKQHLKQHPAANVTVDASDNARIQSSSNVPIGKDTLPQVFPRFMDLPFEIRSQIYRCAVGDRTIHIDSESRDRTMPHDFLFREEQYDKLVPVGFRCQFRISDAEKKQRYLKRGGPEYPSGELDDTFAISCAHNACFYGNDTFIRGNRTTWRLELDLLRVSWEANREATKFFYSTNTFSFKDVPAIHAWLSEIPVTMKLLVRNVHLKMSLYTPKTYNMNARPSTLQWTKCIDERMTVDLPGIQSLSVDLHMMQGFVTCWRKVQAPAISAMLLPLKRLKELGVLDVLIVDEIRPYCLCIQQYYLKHHCWHSYHRGLTGSPEFFEKRIKLREKWAEEIQDSILGQGRN